MPCRGRIAKTNSSYRHRSSHRYGGSGLGVVALLSAVLLATSCAENHGNGDGDLTNGWGEMTAATGFEPVAGTCHGANFTAVLSRSAYEEVDCRQTHRTETAYVGTYGAPASDADQPPADGSAGSRAAYKTCNDQVSTYVGGDWHTARLWIGVTRPTPAAWGGGSRWFRCEVMELSSVEDNGTVVARAASLRGALASGSNLPLACYAVALDDAGAISAMPSVGCGAKHNAEFAGVWTAGKLDYPKSDDDWRRFHNGCRALVASYVGVPNDDTLRFRTGVVSLPGGSDVWDLGDHAVRCYLWVDGPGLTGSLKGKGVTGLPVQYK